MKEFNAAMKAVAEGLRTIAQGMEKIADRFEESSPKEKTKAKPAPKAAKKPRRPAPKKTTPKKAPAKKAVKETASDAVLAVIKRSKKGVDTATLAEKTGFNKKKIANIVFKLRKQGKIASVSKGVYKIA